MNETFGTFRGTCLRQTSGSYGGSRSVFAKFKGIKNNLVYPFNGGIIANPPSGKGFKVFAGDLMEYVTDENYAHPIVKILKTYNVLKLDETYAYIARTPYSHKPFVGDYLGRVTIETGNSLYQGEDFFAPKTNTRDTMVILSVVETKLGSADVWKCAVRKINQVGNTDAGIYEQVVPEDIDENMPPFVTNINAFADCDFEFTEGVDYNKAKKLVDYTLKGIEDTSRVALSGDDFETAKYLYTPAIGGAYMYINRMSPLPERVKYYNASQFRGLFKVADFNMTPLAAMLSVGSKAGIAV